MVILIKNNLIKSKPLDIQTSAHTVFFVCFESCIGRSTCLLFLFTMVTHAGPVATNLITTISFSSIPMKIVLITSKDCWWCDNLCMTMK